MNIKIIIAGASGDLGKAFIKIFQNEKVDLVLLVRNRNSLNEISKYIDIQKKNIDILYADLANKNESLEVASDLEFLLKSDKFDQCFFINCVGSLLPVGKIGNLDSIRIIDSAMCNYVSPMIITNTIIKVARIKKFNVNIINISSGVARKPVPEWSVYSSTKAGFLNFAYTLADETEDEQIKVVSIDPGVMDTKMQKLIRSFPSDRYSFVARFVEYKNKKLLASPEKVARKIKTHFFYNWLSGSDFIKISDLD